VAISRQAIIWSSSHSCGTLHAYVWDRYFLSQALAKSIEEFYGLSPSFLPSLPDDHQGTALYRGGLTVSRSAFRFGLAHPMLINARKPEW